MAQFLYTTVTPQDLAMLPKMEVAFGTNTFTKEKGIRKRIASIFNKREDDFSSLREYNDYLEEVEDMIFNLIEGVDVPAIEANIAEYQRKNAEEIMNARARKAEEYAAALTERKGLTAQIGVDLSSTSQPGTGTGAEGHYAPAIVGAVQPRPIGMAPQPNSIESGQDMSGGWRAEINRKRALSKKLLQAFG